MFYLNRRNGKIYKLIHSFTIQYEVLDLSDSRCKLIPAHIFNKFIKIDNIDSLKNLQILYGDNNEHKSR